MDGVFIHRKASLFELANDTLQHQPSPPALLSILLAEWVSVLAQKVKKGEFILKG